MNIAHAFRRKQHTASVDRIIKLLKRRIRTYPVDLVTHRLLDKDLPSLATYQHMLKKAQQAKRRFYRGDL